MLQGSGLRSPLSLRLGISETQNPFCSLLSLGMANPPAQADNEEVFLENGLLSYENPNYHLDPARLDDALNSNDPEAAAALYKELYHELDAVCNLQSRGGSGSAGARRHYAALDLGAMGVDVSAGPTLKCVLLGAAHSPDSENNRTNSEAGLDNMGRRPQQQYPGADEKRRSSPRPDLIENVLESQRACDSISEKSMDLSSPEEQGEIPHLPGQLNADELYAVPVKRRERNWKNIDEPAEQKQPLLNPDDEDETEETLPPGWEKHEDNDGPYFWHIKSGTIQREPPQSDKKVDGKRVTLRDSENMMPFPTGVTRSSTSSALEELQEGGKRKEDRREEMAYKRRSYPARIEPEAKERSIRFAVRSLGWVEIAEDDLTPERSSRAVNKCIVDLSLGRNDLLDVVGRWGDGKDLFMDLDEGALKLIDPENLTVLNTQPIHTIRVWGVGRDNGRDFAYVARDRGTRKHMCHVFRCDIPARTIANTLRDICKKIMIERSLQQNLAKPIDISAVGSARAGLAVRPTNLPTEHRRFHSRNGQNLITQSFPTPMEEPKKVLKAMYLGAMQVTKSTGMEILNDAIEKMMSNNPKEQWKTVNVAVAPSMISISLPGDDEQIVTECRVRYLSFLGIGKDVKQCAFIMHTAQDLFIAHVFHCEPSSGALCKTIEAACKLRYQKCLDAHPNGLGQGLAEAANNTGKGLGATLKSLVGSLTGRKGKGGSLES
ncbi:protein Fe65 homolog isoform X1 [Cloeon dipterum]|uniref:protein Fe65 homolog isoform X1 n=1 Tax=Cloeon dipterum TaxID=197152 RepID=UPI00321F77D7